LNSTLTREIVAIYVEGDVNIFRVQIRTGRIVKTPDFATGQDQSTNSLWITRPSFKPVPKMDRTEFVFIGSAEAILAHRDKGNLIG
jgi:hypothetical protein